MDFQANPKSDWLTFDIMIMFLIIVRSDGVR